MLGLLIEDDMKWYDTGMQDGGPFVFGGRNVSAHNLRGSQGALPCQCAAAAPPHLTLLPLKRLRPLKGPVLHYFELEYGSVC